MVATTNHLDELDPGLSKRPSRFDRKYLFPQPNQEERVLYGKYSSNLSTIKANPQQHNTGKRSSRTRRASTSPPSSATPSPKSPTTSASRTSKKPSSPRFSTSPGMQKTTVTMMRLEAAIPSKSMSSGAPSRNRSRFCAMTWDLAHLSARVSMQGPRRALLRRTRSCCRCWIR